MKYIRQRKSGKWQLRIYNDTIRHSSTSDDLEELIDQRNYILGYDPDEGEPEVEVTEPKILLIDIETTPILAYVWGLWDQDIRTNQIVEDKRLLSFAWKWLGEADTHVVGLDDFLDKHYEVDAAELTLIGMLHKLLDEANLVIAHNAAKFDIKFINYLFLIHGMFKPSSYRVFDTLKTVRKYFKITSNKLEYVSKVLGGDDKLSHEGMEMWIGCINNNPESWRTMKKYNKRDVDILEKVYLRVRSWENHPNMAHFHKDDDILRCTTCTGTNLVLDRPSVTNTSMFETYRCLDCGQQVRSRTAIQRQPLVNAI